MRFVDSHVHLSDHPDVDLLLSFACSTQCILFSVGVDRSSSEASIALAREQGEIVRAFVGVHPSESGRESLEWLEEAARTASGVGEVGLDPGYAALCEMAAQRRAFNLQLELAERLSLPVQVHSRGAERECLDTLSSYRLRVLMHWFESAELAGTVSSRGYYVSVGPALLYSKRLQRVVSSLPPELVLTESDGPVKFKPLGSVSGPPAVPSVVFRLASERGECFEEVRERVLRNALSFVGERRKG